MLSDIITCIALDNCGSYLVTGSKDCTCIVWSLLPNNNTSAQATPHPANTGHQINTSNSLTPKPLNTLYGHDNTVSCVAIMTELDIVVSGSVVSLIVYIIFFYIAISLFHKDGTVNVYTVKEGQFIQTLAPLGCTGPTIEITYIALSYQGK